MQDFDKRNMCIKRLSVSHKDETLSIALRWNQVSKVFSKHEELVLLWFQARYRIIYVPILGASCKLPQGWDDRVKNKKLTGTVC